MCRPLPSYACVDCPFPVCQGLMLSHYAWYSLSPEAQAGTAILSHALSAVAETYCFTSLGMSLYRFDV